MEQKIIDHLLRDERLKEIIPLVTLPALETNNDVYLDLMSSVVSQQLSVKVADIIFDRFINLFPECDPRPERLVEMDLEELRKCGLSYQKGGYLKNIAAHWVEHHSKGMKDWLSMTDEEIIADLTSIKGVGRWTVQMILMFKLGHLDVFPIDDLGIRQGMVKMYGLEELSGKGLLAELARIAEGWRPYRTVACRYVWRWKDTVKSEKFLVKSEK